MSPGEFGEGESVRLSVVPHLEEPDCSLPVVCSTPVVAGSMGPLAAVSSHGEESSIISLIQQAADAIQELMAPCLAAHQLNEARYSLMRAIQKSPQGECSQSELARCLKQSEANVSTLLDRMRGDGLVSREKSPFDRRRSVVRLSVRGQELLHLAEQEYATRSQAVVRCFSEPESIGLEERLRRLISECASELDLHDAPPAVAGRIGDDTGVSVQTLGDTEIRHAQAG